jgi:hypothetical protein
MAFGSTTVGLVLTSLNHFSNKWKGSFTSILSSKNKFRLSLYWVLRAGTQRNIFVMHFFFQNPDLPLIFMVRSGLVVFFSEKQMNLLLFWCFPVELIRDKILRTHDKKYYKIQRRNNLGISNGTCSEGDQG